MAWGRSGAVNRVPTARPAAASTMAPGRRPWQMTIGMPAAISTRAALILVIMPPEPTAVPASPATAMTDRSMRSTRSMRRASGLRRGLSS